MTSTEKLKLLASDLTTAFPRSPRETLGGYVVVAAPSTNAAPCSQARMANTTSTARWTGSS